MFVEMNYFNIKINTLPMDLDDPTQTIPKFPDESEESSP